MITYNFLDTILNYSQENTIVVRVLIFLLIFIFIHTAMNRIPQFKKSKPTTLIISLVISILAVVYIRDDSITRFILTPYKTLGLLLFTILPFFLILLFTHRSKMISPLRKTVWILFGIIYVYIWVQNYDLLTTTENYISIITTIVIAIMILGDKEIHKMLRKRYD